MDTLGAMRIFVRVVEAGSFSAVGRQLGLAPSSVSRQIGDLEDELSATLFHRTTGKLSLTEARHAYHERAARILEGAIVKRLAMGRAHGVAVIAEGIGERLDPGDLDAIRDVERDEHGHLRLADVPLGAVLRDRVRSDLAARGRKVAIGKKDVGYELRCAAPNSFDLDYTRDLGAGAVRTLLSGRSSVLITRQVGAIVPMPFDELIDPETGRTRVRMVDTDTASHESARALQVRIEPADLEDAQLLKAIADVAGLAPQEAAAHYRLAC